MNRTSEISVFGATVIAFAAGLSFPVAAQQNGTSKPIDVVITNPPVAEFIFDDADHPSLYLEIPPAGATEGSTAVKFSVTGDSDATLSAEPREFMEVPGTQVDQFVSSNAYLGRATRGSHEIGYNVILSFPFNDGSRSLSLTAADPVTSQQVDVSHGTVGGIHIESDPFWTTDGKPAHPGEYDGEIILTLTGS